MVPVGLGAVKYESETAQIVLTPTLRWEIADAGSTFALTSTPAMVPAAEWIPLRVKFRNQLGIVTRVIIRPRAGRLQRSFPSGSTEAQLTIFLRRL